MATRFAAAGAKRVHVVDLDAARGSASNKPVITRMLENSDIQFQVAGEFRSAETGTALLEGCAQWAGWATTAFREQARPRGDPFFTPRVNLGALCIVHDKTP